jgi:hypothetical protein
MQAVNSNQQVNEKTLGTSSASDLVVPDIDCLTTGRIPVSVFATPNGLPFAV